MADDFREKINGMIDKAAELALDATQCSDNQKKDLLWDEYNRILRALKLSVPPKVFSDITAKIDGYVKSKTSR